MLVKQALKMCCPPCISDTLPMHRPPQAQLTYMHANPPLFHPCFSSAGMLGLIESALKAEGITYVRLDGSTPARARAEMLVEFLSASATSPRVFLASLKAGGVGMNLTSAAQVHLMEPSWTPATEDQAMVRVYVCMSS